MPKVLIFAGANGSGKTTLANTIIERPLKFVNADEIKYRENLSDIEAGQKALKEIDRLISEGANFAFETTMSGLRLVHRFNALKKRGYTIIFFYLFAYPLDLLHERIKERVKKGGHDVKYADIIRRYYRSAVNFWNIYKNDAHEWSVINNNEFQYKNIAVGNKAQAQVINEDEFNKFREVVEYAQERKGKKRDSFTDL